MSCSTVWGGDRNLLQSLVEMFPAESNKLYIAIKQGRSAPIAGDVEISAHTLKGICGMFGATIAADFARKLEIGASAGNLRLGYPSAEPWRRIGPGLAGSHQPR